MLTIFFNWFVKVTGWLPQKLIFRTKIEYEDRAAQGRHIKGPAIVIANHTSVFDVGIWMFVFFGRTLRCLVAELIFRKQPLGFFIKLLGGIRVDRDAHDFSFMARSEQILRRGGVLEIYPESRIPRPGEKTPLEFKPSAAYLALSAAGSIPGGVKVIPVYTNGSYFRRARARVIIGTPIDVLQYYDERLSEKENIAWINEVFRERILSLEAQLGEQVTRKGTDKSGTTAQKTTL